MIMLAEAANATKKGGQELIGGLDVRVHRNHFGRQIESFEAGLDLPFLTELDAASVQPAPFRGIFIRAPVVDRVLPHVEGIQSAEARRDATVVAPSKRPLDENAVRRVEEQVHVMGRLPRRAKKSSSEETAAEDEAGDIVAVKQGNVFGTSFHPELTDDVRIHAWWLLQVIQAQR